MTPGLPNGVKNAFQDCQMGAEMRSRTAKCGQKWKILKFCIFHFSDFIDRFYIITYGPDLLIARSPAHRSRSTHFILSPQVAVVLNDFPLTGYRVKPPPELWVCTYYPKIKIRASMRDPNFGAGQSPRQFALGKWRVGGHFWGQLRSKLHSKTAKWGENLKILKNFIFCFFDFADRFYIITHGPDRHLARGPARRSRSTNFILAPQVAPILSDNPLTVYRLKWAQDLWGSNKQSKTLKKNCETLQNAFKTVGNRSKTAENGEKRCKNSWKRWKTMRKQLKPVKTRSDVSRSPETV